MKSRIIVEDFGKIRHVELEMKPMMLFIGDNNSGKSYLMSLLWGLLSSSRKTLIRLTPEIKETGLYQECEKYIKKQIALIDHSAVWMEKEWFEKFWNLLNLCIAQNKDAYVTEIFNKEMRIGRLELYIEMDRKIMFTMGATAYAFEDTRRRTEKLIGVNIPDVGGRGMSLTNEENMWRCVELVLEVLLDCIEKGPVLENHLVFLPASRTGFVLSKNLLIDQIYERSFNMFSDDMQMERSYFTKPIISFLKLLNSIGEIDYKKNNLSGIAEFIEREILYGEVEIKKTLGTSFLYKPDKSEDAIQMYLASAVVTEITPLYLLCKYPHVISQLFIEEPEMCMHPQLQVLVARILVKIHSKGIPVMTTTHSDIIIQHINNMLRIEKSDRRQELMEKHHLDESDLLKADDIGVYQFVCRGGSESEVLELKAGELGFETPTFSNAFEKILDLTYEI